jgi:Acyltransferase
VASAARGTGGAHGRRVSAWLGSYELSGGELLPFAGPAIVAVNHTSIADTAPVLASLYRAGLRPSRRCGKPGCGRTHGHIRFLATPRSCSGTGVDALRHGEIIGIYPEGNIAVDLASDGSPRTFRIGVGRLAQESGAPIVPIAHHDARLSGTGTVRESLAHGRDVGHPTAEDPHPRRPGHPAHGVRRAHRPRDGPARARTRDGGVAHPFRLTCVERQPVDHGAVGRSRPLVPPASP